MIFIWVTIMFISLLILYAVIALGHMAAEEFQAINEALIMLIKREVNKDLKDINA